MKIIKKTFIVILVLALLFCNYIPNAAAVSNKKDGKKAFVKPAAAQSQDNSFASKKSVSKSIRKENDSDVLVLKLKDMKEAKKISGEIVGRYDNTKTIAIKIPEGSNHEDIIKQYKKNSFVEEAFVDEVLRMHYIPNDPLYSYQWYLNRIYMNYAWDTSRGKSSVVVAVVDSGIGPYYDLDGIVNGVDVSSGTILEDTYPGEYTYEGGDHGTAVASLIAANHNYFGIAGIAPNITIMPVKAFPDGEIEVSTVNVAAGIRWAADHGADIINLSLGGDYGTPVLEEAVDYAASKGVILIASSGNEGYINHVSYPAAYDNVIAVGATDRYDYISLFSNEGNALDLVAPGEQIYLPYYPDDTFAYYAGTSFSAPAVTAVAALIKSVYPDYPNDLIENILYAGADDIVVKGWDTSSGYGILNAGKSMDIAGSSYLTDNDDTFANAVKIQANKDYFGGNALRGDIDFYTFTLYEPYLVDITVTPFDNQDIVIELYDANQNLIWIENNYVNGWQETLTEMLDPGTYYICTYDWYGDSYVNGYCIRINADDVTPPEIIVTREGVPIDSGAASDKDLTVEIRDTSYCDVFASRNGVEYSWPENNVFSEAGNYLIFAVDSKGNASDFMFLIQKDVKVPRFKDIPFSHWAYKHIENLAQKSIIKGYEDGTFRPGEYITRAQAAVMIVNAVGLDYKGKVPNFTDVSPNHWAAGHIAAAQAAGIVKGYDDKTFRPGEYITRAQIAVMIVNAFKLKEKGAARNFTDVPSSHWAYKHIEILAQNGIVNGYDGKTFRPGELTTRAHFSVILSNALDKQ